MRSIGYYCRHNAFMELLHPYPLVFKISPCVFPRRKSSIPFAIWKHHTNLMEVWANSTIIGLSFQYAIFHTIFWAILPWKKMSLTREII